MKADSFRPMPLFVPDESTITLSKLPPADSTVLKALGTSVASDSLSDPVFSIILWVSPRCLMAGVFLESSCSEVLGGSDEES